MKTKPACRQPIAITVHQYIAWTHARHPQFARIEIGPVIDISFSCKDRNALAGCATCGMNLEGAAVTSRLHKGHPIGICGTHCLLFEEWQLLDIFQRLDVCRFDVCFVIKLAVKLVLRVGTLDNSLETIQLQSLEPVLGKCLHLFVEELAITHKTSGAETHSRKGVGSKRLPFLCITIAITAVDGSHVPG